MAVFEFDSVTGLQDYLTHPAHAALAEQFWKHCERTMILDVEAEDPRVSIRLESERTNSAGPEVPGSTSPS
jgi:hypothetical protein